jgi:glycosyltransferase involved in cell wall biosynthesis
MNIWYLSAYDQPMGQSSRTYEYSRELVRRGHQVTMFTNSYSHFTHHERLNADEPYRIEQIDGIRVVWLRTIPYTDNGWRRGANMLSNAWRSFQVSRHLQDIPDIVVGPSVPILTGWAASVIAKHKDAAFIFEVRDIWPQSLVDLGALTTHSPVYFAFRNLEKYLYRRARRISAVLPLTWKHVARSGVAPDKVIWIPNGANLENYKDIPPYDGGTKHSLTVMYVGGFSITHDVITILRAAHVLSIRGTNEIRIIIVGSGRQRSECEKEAANLGLKNVEFRDPVPKSQIPRLQCEADVLVSSVKDTPVYQFGINSNKIFDYLAASRPVIFAGNAPNDPISESGAGFNIPPENPDAMADSLETMLRMSPEGRVEIGLRGRRYAEEHFELKKLAARMEDMFNDSYLERGAGSHHGE